MQARLTTMVLAIALSHAHTATQSVSPSVHKERTN